jgi:hypothetical protein
MKPSVYLYNETDKDYELYLGGYSTLEGLSVFDESASLSITSFGATLYKKYGWATEKELPQLDSVGSLIKFLKLEGDIGIIDFKAVLPELGTFGTHDDGECNYVLKSKHQCMSVLKTVINPQHSDMFINKLVSNPGLYLTCNKSGKVAKYSSFDEYLAKNA